MALKEIRVTKNSLPMPQVRLVQGDANTQVLRFLVKKDYGGTDLTGLVWSVWVQCENGEAEVSYIGAATVVGDDLQIDWKVIAAVTKAPGMTEIKLVGSNAESSGTEYVWESGKMIISVSESEIDPMYGEDDIVVLRQLITDFGNQAAESKAYVDTTIATEKAYVDAQTAANKSYVDTNIAADTAAQALLTARMDTIVPSGVQTEGNTELIDIRTGADGTSYANAGTAVRTQISQLKTELNSDISELKTEIDYADLFELTNIQSKSGAANGLYIRSSTGVIGTDSGNIGYYIKCEKSTLYIVKRSSASGYWGFGYTSGNDIAAEVQLDKWTANNTTDEIELKTDGNSTLLFWYCPSGQTVTLYKKSPKTDISESVSIRKTEGTGFVPIYNTSIKNLKSLECNNPSSELTVSSGNLMNMNLWANAPKSNCTCTISNGTLDILATGSDAFLDTLNNSYLIPVHPSTTYTVQIYREQISSDSCSSNNYYREFDGSKTAGTVKTLPGFNAGQTYKKITITTGETTYYLALRLGVSAAGCEYKFRVSLTRGQYEIPYNTYVEPATITTQDFASASLCSPYSMIEAYPNATISAEYYQNNDNLTSFATPEQYGAVGDGVSDDTVYVETALRNSKIVTFNKKYLVTRDINLNASNVITGNGEIVLDNASIICNDLERSGFAIKDVTLTVKSGSTASAIKIVHCFDGTINNVNICNSAEFSNETWKGIELYADSSTGGTSFIKVSNLLIRNPGIGIYIYGDNKSYVTSCHFNNVVIERFSSKAVNIVGYKTYAITFDGLSIDDNFASNNARYGIKLDYVSGAYFNNIVIWADAKGYTYQFYPIYITDLSSYSSPNRFYGYVEGMIESHTITELGHCDYSFFYQEADSISGTITNKGVVANRLGSPLA